VLSPIAGNAKEVEDLLLLDGATNDHVQSEQQGFLGISTFELVYAIPHAHIVNAAYTHPNESGSRFNDHTRGAWYAADCQKASIAEVVYHKSKRLSDIIVPDEPNRRLRGMCQRTTIGWRNSKPTFTSYTRRRTFRKSCNRSLCRGVIPPRKR
jgi:hypothetical protein